MTNITILYDLKDDNDQMRFPVELWGESLARKHGVRINIDFTYHGQILERLKTNPGYYDLVVLHLGGHQRDWNAYQFADRCRPLTSAVLVAESGIYPEGKDEVLRHFDAYVDLIINPHSNSLESVLQDQGFLPPLRTP